MLIPSALLILVIGCESALGSDSWERPSPSFIDTPTNVSVHEEEHAFLPCRISNLGDRSVTWIRKSNLHIISAGKFTYAPDDRYKVLHPPNSDEWTLHIKSASQADAGVFECQVNSHPKLVRMVRLLVNDPIVHDPYYKHENDYDTNSSIVSIEGPAERFIQSGSLLTITCHVYHSGHHGPDSLKWFHGGTELDYDSPRGGISLQTEKTKNNTISTLMLSSVVSSDSGRYTCLPDSGGSGAIIIHVQKGQHHAAVQQSSGNSVHNEAILIFLPFVFVFQPCLIFLFNYTFCFSRSSTKTTRVLI